MHCYLLVVYRGSRRDAICLSDMVGDGGLAWLPGSRFPRASTSRHLTPSHPREVDDNRREEPLAPVQSQGDERAVSEDGKRTPQIGWERWEEKVSSYSIEIRNMGNASTMGPVQTE